MPSVFISYSQDPAHPEHRARVAGLVASLLRDGLTVFSDQNRDADEEKIPWPRWMEDKIEAADHVLLVCTELYLKKMRQEVPNDFGHGVCWEANLIFNALYLSKLNTSKFIPVVFTDADRRFIPLPLRSRDSFVLDSPLGYKRLFAFITGQHRRRFPERGAHLPVITQESVQPLFPPPEGIEEKRSLEDRKGEIAIAGSSGDESLKSATLAGAFARAEEAARFVERKTPFRPRIGVLLGSGIDSLIERVTDTSMISYDSIPNFPRTPISERDGCLIIGKLDNVPLAVMRGRLHYYEGGGLDAVVFPIRLLSRLGIRALVITSAAAGINPEFTPGSLVLLSDQINLLGSNPMVGLADERLGSRFADMSEVFSRRYRQLAVSSAGELGFTLAEGVFAAHSGPSYETPAEVRSLRNQGADLVGMSIVPETIAARHAGIKVLAICAVTNVAAGVETEAMSHDEVLSLARLLRKRFAALLERVIPLIATEL